MNCNYVIKPNKYKYKIQNEYTLQEKLGEGTFCKVYLGYHNLTNEKVFFNNYFR
jgi:hypothetical protein